MQTWTKSYFHQQSDINYPNAIKLFVYVKAFSAYMLRSKDPHMVLTTRGGFVLNYS